MSFMPRRSLVVVLTALLTSASGVLLAPASADAALRAVAASPAVVRTAVASSSAGVSTTSARSRVVPTPVVRGPIASDLSTAGTSTKNYTFFASDLGLNRRGYVEEEFFYSGTANVYDATMAAGIGARPEASPTAGIVSSGHAYTTRMVVRRPASPRAFNGTVVVEWLNATSGYDVEALWQREHEFLLRSGYAWVGITAQSLPITNPVAGLKAFSPTRYGSLDLTDSGTLTSGDPLSYDVYSQGLQAIRRAGVLGSLKTHVRTVLASGVSQSAGRVAVWTNAIQTRTRQVADAVLLYIGGEKLRTDLRLPVLKLLSETEFAAPLTSGANEISSLQPDTSTIRTWAMAGTSHSDWASFAVRYALLKRDVPTASLADACSRPSRSRIPDRYVIASAITRLVRWAAEGVAPQSAPLISLEADGVTVARDAHGNALGGIRLAPLAVPTALSTGVNENPPGGTGLCFLNGTWIPFDTSTLAALYPTRASYLRPFAAAVRENVSDGFVLPRDATEMLAAARASVVGSGLVCGPLCANASQFPLQPSTGLLRDHTALLYMKGGERLVAAVDVATWNVARAYANAAHAKRYVTAATSALRGYQRLIDRQVALHRMTSGQADLLSGYAQVLIDRIGALA